MSLVINGRFLSDAKSTAAFASGDISPRTALETALAVFSSPLPIPPMPAEITVCNGSISSPPARLVAPCSAKSVAADFPMAPSTVPALPAGVNANALARNEVRSCGDKPGLFRA